MINGQFWIFDLGTACYTLWRSMLQLVIDVSSLERMATTQPDVLLLYVLMPLGALMVLSMFVWGAIMVLLDRRQGKFLSSKNGWSLPLMCRKTNSRPRR